MRPMLVRNIDDEDIYINPKQIETIRRDNFKRTIITFVSGNSISINKSAYDFVQDLKRLPVDKVTLY